jgi:hypothetical protein
MSTYIQNYADKGFQFEQIVTGKPIATHKEISFHEHLHVVKVGAYKVLIMADADAVQDGETVEITASNPRYWGTKKFFQCLSNGSPSLCHGTKWKNTKITSIKLKSLSEMAQEALAFENVRTLERNIIEDGMESIQSQLEPFKKGTDCKLSFVAGKLKLAKFSGGGNHLLPLGSVVEKLLFD